ncbi:MAG: class II fumarate hydratase [Gammaproteobacteria bacterium]
MSTAIGGLRVERDSMGEVHVPAHMLYGAQTQRAVENFPVSGTPMPRGFIRALGLVKASAARVHGVANAIEPSVARAIESAAHAVAQGEHDDQFPVDVFQTGSGTSSNMNANEVIASLASTLAGQSVHPNDHVNRSQSSNDVIPTAVHVSAALGLSESLLPALGHFGYTCNARAATLENVVKTGRTHLMDAMPVTFAQEVSTWGTQIRECSMRIEATMPRLLSLAIGGTAVGTGINADAEFGKQVAAELQQRTGLHFTSAENKFVRMSTHDTAVELSGQLRTLAVSLMKIANDLRWMNSGPLAGLGEIRLRALQPGSSIMPAKVNAVVPESVCMVCARVMGNDHTIAIAGQSGNFQLNVMQPLIAYDLLQSIELLTSATRLLADRCIADFEIDLEHVQSTLAQNPILVTALNSRIGYDKGAAIAKRAYAERRAVLDVALEETDLTRTELEALLSPLALTR